MAEYVEVMEQKRRMCNSYALCCMGCPLEAINFCGKNSGERTSADFSEVERRVMAWAAEHPKPVYPSYLEVFGWGHEKTWAEIKDILASPIPDDIAQKLGIEPKEGA